MLNKDKLLSHVRDQDARQVLVKVLDKAEITLKRSSIENTDFLDPYHLEMAKGILRGMDLNFHPWGGFPAAERSKLALGPEFRELTDADVELTILKLTVGSDFVSLSHRDYLGSLLGLGIRREKVGDFVVTQEGAWVALDSTIAQFVKQNLSKVGRAPVKIEEVSAADIDMPEAQVKEIRATVPSLRLDAVAGEGFGLSRSKIAGAIESGKVRVNWKPVEQCSYQLKEGDLISCRGLGRTVLSEVRGETKKRRIAILLKRYI